MSIVRQFSFPFSECDKWQDLVLAIYGTRCKILLSRCEKPMVELKNLKTVSLASHVKDTFSPAKPSSRITIQLSEIPNAAVFRDMMPRDFDVDAAPILKMRPPSFLKELIGIILRDSDFLDSHNLGMAHHLPIEWFPYIVSAIHGAVGLTSVYYLAVDKRNLLFLGLDNENKELLILSAKSKRVDVHFIPTAHQRIDHMDIPMFDIDDGFYFTPPVKMNGRMHQPVPLPVPVPNDSALATSFRKWVVAGRPTNGPILKLHGPLKPMRINHKKRLAPDAADDIARPTKKRKRSPLSDEETKDWFLQSLTPWQRKVGLELLTSETSQ